MEKKIRRRDLPQRGGLRFALEVKMKTNKLPNEGKVKNIGGKGLDICEMEQWTFLNRNTNFIKCEKV